MSAPVRRPEARPAELDVAQPTDREFRAFSALIETRTGIHLPDSKKALLHGRLVRRIRELGLGSFGEYFARIEGENDGLELAEMIDRITTNETHFFREPRHFEYLEQTLFPAWIAAAERGARPKQVRIWSAGCSSGEEPFSLAMVALAAFPAVAGWSVEVHGTDVSTRMVAAARRATWPIEKAQDIPAHYLKRFMLKGIGAQRGNLRAGPELRQVVHIDWLNLNAAAYPLRPGFDVVFCRNVLIYFSATRKQHVIERLTERLAPGGRLFVGHAESIAHTGGALAVVAPTICARSAERNRSNRAMEHGS